MSRMQEYSPFGQDHHATSQRNFDGSSSRIQEKPSRSSSHRRDREDSQRGESRGRDHGKERHRGKDEEKRRERKSRSRSADKYGRSKNRGKRSRSRSDSASENDHDDSHSKSLSKPKVDKDKETPEEKRARRLAKKLAKEKKRAELEKHLGSEMDAFGDPDLHKTFVWKKKLVKEGTEHLTVDDIKKQNKDKLWATRTELEKVRERRQQYERERAAREEEVQMVQREKEATQFKLWEGQEDSFHLKQAQLRSEIRIRDGRAKPVDLLARYISSADDLSVDIHEPYTYIEGLNKKDLEDLLEDIIIYQKLDRDGNVDYWSDVTIVAEEELNKILRSEAEAERRAGRQGINSAVISEVSSVFKGKTLPQLIELEKEIRGKVSSRSDGVDVSYWENLLQQIKAHMAKIRLRDRHQNNLKKKLEELKREQGIEDQQDNFKVPSIPLEKPVKLEVDSVPEAVQTEEELQTISEYNSGRYSPNLIPFADIGVEVHLVEMVDDLRKLQLAREQVSKTGSAAIVTTEDHVFEREARKGMGDDEAQFSVESVLDQPTYVWSDKYRPRKPRYFNRVHTGFEWNKYNQTHYDLDNPPPKVVQGYKFNIFYPDLIDKGVTPRYTANLCKDNSDFSILRISAGPPYEDIAFKIVNREWEYSYKRGFRCQFHNNIFQLWFHFKRYRYRR